MNYSFEFRRDGSRKLPNCDCGALIRGKRGGNICEKCGCCACKKCCKERSSGKVICNGCYIQKTDSLTEKDTSNVKTI